MSMELMLGPDYLRKLLRLVAVSDNLLRTILSKNANKLGEFVKNQDSSSILKVSYK
jgi:hypothetical protein